MRESVHTPVLKGVPEADPEPRTEGQVLHPGSDPRKQGGVGENPREGTLRAGVQNIHQAFKAGKQEAGVFVQPPPLEAQDLGHRPSAAGRSSWIERGRREAEAGLLLGEAVHGSASAPSRTPPGE